ncbi:MAG: 50S ribosomal protein L2 [Candidatus Bathyarchaeia archaeon]
MGKKIRVQRRGAGTPTFRAATHKRVAPARYPFTSLAQTETLKGVVSCLVHDPGRGAPLALIRLANGTDFYNIASEGLYVGREIEIGEEASVSVGNILPLSKIPEGTMVYNIERLPGDGGRFIRSSGGYATVIAHTPAGIALKLSSGKTVYLDGRCRATIGVAAGAGRTDKPFLKAGERFHLMRAKGHDYPIVKGVAMIAAVHPHGGGRHKTGSLKPTTVARGAPPGQKVGLIAARQTGRAEKSKKAMVA